MCDCFTNQAIVVCNGMGYGVMQIVGLSGLSYPMVRAMIDQYEEGGMAAIKPAARGKQAGQGRTLTAEQEARPSARSFATSGQGN